MTTMHIGDWVYSIEHQEIGRIVDTRTLWGTTLYTVWLPTRNSVTRLRADQVRPLAEAGRLGPAELAYTAAAARVADTLTQDVLLAPIEASVIPLPHQVRVLTRAVAREQVRYLLADEVGLGKTIEAGLILRELKLRGLVKRILVVAPKGLVTQWVAEMQTHFGETFHLLIPGDFSAYRRLTGAENLWRMYHQVVCPLDSVKPIENRRGWSREQVAAYNQERFDDLVTAGWDLVIIDEAHRLGGSTDQVARYRLGQALAEATPYLLLLSATPHQGKTDAFARLVTLLDPTAFPTAASVTRERVRPYVIRTEKRRAIDTQGQPLFRPRQTRLVPVAYAQQHRHQQRLYEAVTAYVREGYNQAIQAKKNYIGFLMILMQRLVTSSTHAIRTTLERRLEVLQVPDEQLTFLPAFAADEWEDLDGQEQLETLLTSRLAALKSERTEVEFLLELTHRTEAAGPDAKAAALLDWIYRVQREERDADLKVLIFTEFVPTQAMLQAFLTERGFTVVCLNGAMSLDERRQVQAAFADTTRILISTDAGGEGLNLQFCHVVINYDIPWNPMRLEQRIGRVDRIGQAHTVLALNFVLEDTVEYRVREVLEAKLAVILDEFGVDKTSDVLDSAHAGQLFDTLYVEALLHPDSLADNVDSLVSQVRAQAQHARESQAIFSAEEALDPAAVQHIADHPLQHWIERMTTTYLEAHGGHAVLHGNTWELTWPTSEHLSQVVFTARDAALLPTTHHLTLEDARVRDLATRLPHVTEGQPVPWLTLPDLPSDVCGAWSLWRIAIHSEDWSKQRVFPLFLHDNGRIFLPTARYIWDQFLTGTPTIQGYLTGTAATDLFKQVWKAAESHGETLYAELVQAHQERLAQECEKRAYAWSARRRALERIGLPAVRAHRLALLDQEERDWEAHVLQRSTISPDMTPLLIARVQSTGVNDQEND